MYSQKNIPFNHKAMTSGIKEFNLRNQARLSAESSVSPIGLAQVPGQSEAGRRWH